MASPSIRQLEKHIRQGAKDSFNVTFTHHARLKMRQRLVNDLMAMEVLRQGNLALPPEPDMKHAGLVCRMQRFVAGMQVAVVVPVEHPAPALTVVTVIDVTKS